MITNYGHILITNVPEEVYNLLYTVDETLNNYDRFITSDEYKNDIENELKIAAYDYLRGFTKVLNVYAHYGDTRHEFTDLEKILPTDIAFEQLVNEFKDLIEEIIRIADNRHNLQPEIVALYKERMYKVFKQGRANKERVNKFLRRCYLETLAMEAEV